MMDIITIMMNHNHNGNDQSKVLSCLNVLVGGSLAFAGINIYQSNEKFYSQLLMPAIHRCLDAESAHRMAIRLAKHKLVPRSGELTPEQNKLLVSADLWIIFSDENMIMITVANDYDYFDCTNISCPNTGNISVRIKVQEPRRSGCRI